MLTETDIYLKLLLEDSEYAKIEDNLVWLLDHDKLTPAQKIEYGCQIYEIDRFYNPYTKIEALFQRIYRLAADSNELKHPGLVKLAEKVMDFLEKQNWKKDI